jgi:hypothetical protein
MPASETIFADVRVAASVQQGSARGLKKVVKILGDVSRAVRELRQSRFSQVATRIVRRLVGTVGGVNP